jgi:hypothetical protein
MVGSDKQDGSKMIKYEANFPYGILFNLELNELPHARFFDSEEERDKRFEEAINTGFLMLDELWRSPVPSRYKVINIQRINEIDSYRAMGVG